MSNQEDMQEDEVPSGQEENQKAPRARRISHFGVLQETHQSVFAQEYFDRNPARFLRFFLRMREEGDQKLNELMHQIFDFPETFDPMLLNVTTTVVNEKKIKNFRIKYILEGSRRVIVDLKLAQWIIENGGLVMMKDMNPVISNTKILVISYAYLIADKYGFQHSPGRATDPLTKQMIDDLGDLVSIPEQYEYDIHTWVGNFSRMSQNYHWLMKWAMDCGVVRGPVSDSFMELMKTRLSYIIKRRIRSFDEDAILSEESSEELSRGWRDYYTAYLASPEGQQDLIKYNFTNAIEWYLENVQDEEVPEDLPKIRSKDRDYFPTKWNFDMPCTRMKKDVQAKLKSPQVNKEEATTPAKTSKKGKKKKDMLGVSVKKNQLDINVLLKNRSKTSACEQEDDMFDGQDHPYEAFDMSAMAHLLQNTYEKYQSNLETEESKNKQLQEMKKSNSVCMLLLEDIKMKLSVKEPVGEQLDLLAEHIRQQNLLLNNMIGKNFTNTGIDIKKELTDGEDGNNNYYNDYYYPNEMVPDAVLEED